MKVLIIGSGGREHSITLMVAKSTMVEEIYCAPGNAGTAQIAENVDIKADDITSLFAFAKENSIDLTIVGPEAPLANGIVDLFTGGSLNIIGPTRFAAQLESSKLFTKEICDECNIPTADYSVFYNFDDLERFVLNKQLPFVIKIDGLAAGKGALVCKSMKDVRAAMKRIKSGEFGSAANVVIVEDFLQGEEASFIVLVDENGNILPFASSQDHKAAYDGDKGPNTGGMGAYSPAPVVTELVETRILERIIYPAIKEMKLQGIPFTGFLYAGVMIDQDGNPYLVEFNVRMGDPECQVILARMRTDLVEVFQAAVAGNLDKIKIDWDSRKALCVVAASKAYPGKYETGFEIHGLEAVAEAGGQVIHAGTKLENGKVKTNGGRVLGVVGLSDTFTATKKNTYAAADHLFFVNIYMRRDIGHKAVAREN